MKKFLLSVFLLLPLFLFCQRFGGKIFMKDQADIFLNQVYVTNLNTQKTVLSSYDGVFSIAAAAGDVIRFSSLISERKDVKVTQILLDNTGNFFELKPSYHEIQEVVLRYKPTGNLKSDVLALKASEKSFEIAKMVGLPEPKGDGTPPLEAPVSFSGGLALNIQSIYDIISGERKKKERLYEFEKMSRNIALMRTYFGDAYFADMRIPVNFIDNFLQFVYTSDNMSFLIEANNIEGTKPYLEKYLAVYQKRVRASRLGQDLSL